MAVPIKLIFAGLATGILVLGILDCLTNFEQNGCEMTYMFQYPKYLDVPLDNSITHQFPNYRLYVYGEGDYARQISKMEFSGIPVLFLPGNAGSYRQVRSLGSVSLRMSEKPGIKFHFNYFVADFNEELSAIHGAFLQRQTEFVHACVKKILSLYKSSKNPPTSVILVGHSMGGVLTRALFTLPGFDAQSVHTIITQASPHQAPVVTFDSALHTFYQRVNDYWYHHSNSTLAHVTAVSCGGGYRDFQVRSGLTSLRDILPESRGVSTTTMSVPLSWVSTDHLCSVWCRQMVLTTVGALFDIVDRKTLQPTSDVDHRAKVFQHHFLLNNGQEFKSSEDKTISLDKKLPWEVRTERVWRYYADKVTASKYIAVPLVSLQGDLKTDSITLISNITASNWVCACHILEGEERCTDCLSLVKKARLLPPRYSQRKFIRLQVEELGENTHLVLHVPKGSKQVEVIVDKYSMDTRHLVYELPSVYDSIISFPISMTDGTAMLQIQNNTVFYSLHLAGLFSPLTAYTAIVSPRHCDHRVQPGLYEGSVMTLSVPWSEENTYQFFRYGEKGSLPIKLQTPRQVSADDRYGFEHSEAHLEMYLHPGCHYQLRLLMSPHQAFGQFVRFFGALMPVMFVVVLLLALGGQLAAFAKDGECLWMPEAVYMYSKPFYVVPVAMVLHAVTNIKAVWRLVSSLGVPPNDITELQSRDLWLQLLLVMLCMLSWLVTIFLCYVTHYLIAARSRLIALLFFWVPERVVSIGATLQLGAVILACVCSLLCGAAGICIVFAVLLFKVQHLYDVSVRGGMGKVEVSRYRFCFLLTMLYMWLAIINAPAFAVWAKGIGSSIYLPMDPSRWPAVVASLCALLFITTDSPLPERVYARQLRWTMYATCVVSIPYCLIRLYHLNFVIPFTLVLMASTRLPSLLTRSDEHRKAE
ncbi:GPI inositol-deacylase-like [Babylonia areolata]|uniref:GPI inositol-deacylase-like n=1 Tax=Babylonia areolata TaxID=304850 RepID=UPI003FD5A4F6